jgi:Clostripain family
MVRILIYFLIFLFHTSVLPTHNLEASSKDIELVSSETDAIRSGINISYLLNEIDQHILAPLEVDESLLAKNSSTPNKAPKNKKKWTFITYMAADNDLSPFARKNLKQQADVGSNDTINIVTQLDTRVAGNKKITKRYYIEKNKLIVTNQNDPSTQRMDSGSPNTLIDCCKWAIENYPAENYVLVLWNHGTGELDVGPRKSINPWSLFMFNPDNNLIELDRSIPFFDFVQSTLAIDQRAICFDDSTGHYLSNQDLDMALNHICTTFLGGKKFSLICFDACLMSMIGIAMITKKYANYMVASQEVELGTGYDYYKILFPFWHQSLEPEIFAEHIVNAYEQSYGQITNDFTQSALDLSKITNIEKNIDQVASLLVECLIAQKGSTVTEAIKASRHKLFCTHFDETSYLDLAHLYENLSTNIKRFSLNNPSEEKTIKMRLEKLLSEGLALITRAVIANKVGKNLSHAKGISIYFPERRLHSSYNKTSFAQSNQWFSFLKTYLALVNKGSRDVL